MQRPRSWASLLRTARAPVGVLVLGAVGLGLPPQTRDMTEALDGLGARIALHVALALLALSAWFWSRAVIGARFGIDDDVLDRQIKLDHPDARANRTAFMWVPRVLFGVAALLGLILLLLAWSLGSALLLVVWSAIGIWLLYWRKPNAANGPAPNGASTISPDKWWAQLHEPPAPGYWRLLWRAIVSMVSAVRTRWSLLLAYAPFPTPVSRNVLRLSLLVFAAGAADSLVPAGWTAWPNVAVSLARLFPGPAVAVLLLALMIGPLTLLTFIADRVRFRVAIRGLPVGLNRPPVLLALALFVFVLSPDLLARDSVHNVRIVYADLPDRMTLPEMFAAWRARCALRGDGRPLYPVIVAVSGGATRAEVWAASVLHAVEDAAGAGGPMVFAVSSVSGGSLGAGAYMAVLAAHRPTAGSCTEPEGARRASNLGLDVLRPPGALSRDALGPLLAGWLVETIPRALLDPGVVLVRWLTGASGARSRGGDGGETIERGFELLWAQTAQPGMPGLDEPFLSLFYAPAVGFRPAWRGAMPLWISNGTDAGTGNRVVTVPFKADAAGSHWPFPATADVLGMLDADVPTSTAINNSARFPFLEPSGGLLPQGGGKLAGHLIDGGYFENEGLQTALDLAGWLRRWGRRHGSDVRPIIVEATADGEATTTAGSITRCGLHASAPDLPEPAAQTQEFQVLAPVLGLYNVRGGHSAVLLREAQRRFCGKAGGQRFFHFYLPGIDGTDVPLNWVLSDSTALRLWKAINDTTVENDRELACMRATFHAMTTGIPANTTNICGGVPAANHQ